MSTINISPNRQLAWSEWGAPQGKPVIMCNGAGMAGSLPFGEEAAKQLGLRLICVDRPGLGRSSPDPEKSFASWAQDVRALLAHFHAPSAYALGFSQGAPFALALADAGLVEKLALVSGQDELAYPSILSLLPEPVAAMVQRAGTEPQLQENEIALHANADWLWQMIETMSSPQDRAFYASADFAPAYKAALSAGFVQGAAGYARDTVLAMAPWPFRVENLQCPVQLWYGLEDTSPVHSPDFGQTLSQRLKSAERVCFENEGSAILWTKADIILKALAG